MIERGNARLAGVGGLELFRRWWRDERADPIRRPRWSCWYTAPASTRDATSTSPSGWSATATPSTRLTIAATVARRARAR